jgi:exopolyphosphatase/guanosine-5'-triphosphate,3'-diphosphate pyrophosphatase
MTEDLSAPQIVAAIDIGSNAMRLLVAKNNSNKIETILTEREAVRLGADVFKDGYIAEATIEKSVAALSRFKVVLEEAGVDSLRAIGTSALRDAKNQADFVARIKDQVGIKIDVIDGEEEARLVYLAVSETIGFSKELDLLIDLGGGSLEATLCQAGDILFSESSQIGTVRLLKMFNADTNSPKTFARLVRAYSRSIGTTITQQLAGRNISRCIGTGGNLETFLNLREKFLSGKGKFILREDLEHILERLLELNLEQRIEQFELRADRADVIVPAAIVILEILKSANIDRIEVPSVGVREGVAYELFQANQEQNPHFERAHLTQAAIEIGKKYRFIEAHAKNVASLALSLFEQTRALHDYGEEEKKLLELAALLHDIGHFVSSRSHHKHSYYLIQSASFPGLTKKEKLIVGLVARYHRKKFPQYSHVGYSELSEVDQNRVQRLGAILRLADGLDRDHNQQVVDLQFLINSETKSAKLLLEGRGDLALDTWSSKIKADLFEHVFGIVLSEVVAANGN